MLSNYSPVPTLPVSDLDKAREYYEQTLGLSVQQDTPGGVTYTCGGGQLFVYPSEYAGTNKGTAASFDVPIIGLRQRGGLVAGPGRGVHDLRDGRHRVERRGRHHG